MNKGAITALAVLVVIVGGLSMGCIGLDPTYSVQITCPLDSYQYTGLTAGQVEDVTRDVPYWCSVQVMQE